MSTQGWPPPPPRRPPSGTGDTTGGWSVPMYTPEPRDQWQPPPEEPVYHSPPDPLTGTGWQEEREPDADTFSGMWIWITDDQAQLVRRRTIARSARRLSLALLLLALGALAAITVLSEQVVTDTDRLDQLALAAFCVAAGTPLLLLVTHLRWWRNARLARRLDETLLERTERQQVRASHQRAFERAMVALGWVALATSGRAAAPLLSRVSRNDLADLLFRYGAWVWLAAAVVALVMLSVWVVRLITATPGPGDTGSWDPLATTLYGPRLRRARWSGRIVWPLAAAGVVAADVVDLGLWTPDRPVLLALLALPVVCVLLVTWTGWRYDRQERHAAETMPRHSQT